MTQAEEIKQWKDLLDSGVISEQDFEKKKTEIMKKSSKPTETVKFIAFCLVLFVGFAVLELLSMIF